MTTRRVVLITGAGGNLGGKIRRHLEQYEEYEVRPFGHTARPEDPGLICADLSQYCDSWADHFRDVDTIVHMAADPKPIATWDSIQQLNIDLTLNVYQAAVTHKVRRVVFGSSNWVLGGYRWSGIPLTSDLPPWPVNPYGASKLFAERAGRSFADRYGLSVINLRIGYCQRLPGNRPGSHMTFGRWGQRMWLSDRDFCQAVEKAILAPDVPFATLNIMSANKNSLWDLDEARRTIGYVPDDGFEGALTPTVLFKEVMAWFRDQPLSALGRTIAGPRW